MQFVVHFESCPRKVKQHARHALRRRQKTLALLNVISFLKEKKNHAALSCMHCALAWLCSSASWFFFNRKDVQQNLLAGIKSLHILLSCSQSQGWWWTVHATPPAGPQHLTCVGWRAWHACMHAWTLPCRMDYSCTYTLISRSMQPAWAVSAKTEGLI
jgi:hypothetical protein